MPGILSGHPVAGEYKYGDLVLQVVGVPNLSKIWPRIPRNLNLRNVLARTSRNCKHRPSLSSRRKLHNDYYRHVFSWKKITGRGSQRTCQQGLLGGKEPVIK
jgi:hypothetical protein